MLKVSNSVDSFDYVVVDGCPSGWVAASIRGKNIHIFYHQFLDVFNLQSIQNIFIDMPVKLPEFLSDYPRSSDKQAKRLLGQFHSSIFYSPLEEWLDMSYEEINFLCHQNNLPKLSKQSYHLFPKLRELNKFQQLFPNDIFEIHPELLVYYFLSKEKLSKKQLDGQYQRLNLINDLFGFNVSFNEVKNVIQTLKLNNSTLRINVDDIIDVIFVCCLIEKFGFRFKRIIDKDTLYSWFSLFF